MTVLDAPLLEAPLPDRTSAVVAMKVIGHFTATYRTRIRAFVNAVNAVVAYVWSGR